MMMMRLLMGGGMKLMGMAIGRGVDLGLPQELIGGVIQLVKYICGYCRFERIWHKDLAAAG